MPSKVKSKLRLVIEPVRDGAAKNAVPSIISQYVVGTRVMEEADVTAQAIAGIIGIVGIGGTISVPYTDPKGIEGIISISVYPKPTEADEAE